MPLQGEAKRNYQKDLMRKRRSNKKGLTEEGSNIAKLTEYHPILYALVDPIKRDKLQRICDSLRRRGLLRGVYYGMKQPLDFGTVSDLLEATQ